MISSVYFFFFKFLQTRLSVGGASLLENCILEGDELGNFPVNAFVFLSIVFGLIFNFNKFNAFMIKCAPWDVQACKSVLLG